MDASLQEVIVSHGCWGRLTTLCLKPFILNSNQACFTLPICNRTSQFADLLHSEGSRGWNQEAARSQESGEVNVGKNGTIFSDVVHNYTAFCSYDQMSLCRNTGAVDESTFVKESDAAQNDRARGSAVESPFANHSSSGQGCLHEG